MPSPMPRLPRVERLVGVGLDDLTEADLQRLVDESASEGEDLDFKGGVYWVGPNKWELGKDVALFANHVGGLLIVGVEEDGNARATGLAPCAIDDNVERTVQEIVADHVHPTPTVVTRQVDGTDGRYLLIAVPRSPLAPHAIQSPGTDRLGYPVRSGTGTRWLTETEVADRYRSRFRDGADTVDVAARRLAELPDRLLLDGAWLAISVAPDLPGRVDIDAATGRSTSHWLRELPATGLEQDSMIFDMPVARFAPGRFVFGLQQEQLSHGYHLELFGDGACVAAIDISDNPDEGMFTIPESTLTRAMVTAVGLAAHYAVDRGGTATSAMVIAEIIEPRRGRTGHLEHSMILKGARPAGNIGFHQYQRIAGSGAPFTIPPSRHVIDLEAVRSSMVERIAASHLLLRELVQGFGLAEPVHLTSAGELRARYFQPPVPTQWATSAGVALVDSML